MKLFIEVKYGLAISRNFLVAQLVTLAKTMYAMQPEYTYPS